QEATTLVASVVPVSDEATRPLMLRYHKALEATGSPAAALASVGESRAVTTRRPMPPQRRSSASEPAGSEAGRARGTGTAGCVEYSTLFVENSTQGCPTRAHSIGL